MLPARPVLADPAPEVERDAEVGDHDHEDADGDAADDGAVVADPVLHLGVAALVVQAVRGGGAALALILENIK